MRDHGGGSRAFLGAGAAMMAARIAAAAMALGWTLGLAGLGAPGDLGRVMAAIALVELVSIAVTLNAESGAIRALQGPAGRAAGFTRLCLRMVVVAGPVAASLLLGVVILRAGGPGAWVAGGWSADLAMTTALPLLALGRVGARLATARGRALRGVLPRLLVPQGALCAMLAGFWAAGVAPSAEAVLWAWAGGVATVPVLQGRAPWAGTPAAPEMSDWRVWIRAGVSMAPALALQEYRRALILGAAALALGHSDLAALGVAVSLTGLVFYALVAVDSVTAARLAAAVARGDAAARGLMLRHAGMLRLGAALAGLATVAPAAGPLSAAFGPAYAGVPVAALILLCVPLVQALAGPAALVLNAAGAHGAIGRASLAGLLAVGLGAALGGGAGAPGAAAGAASGLALQAVLMRRAARARCGIDPAFHAVWRGRSGG